MGQSMDINHDCYPGDMTSDGFQGKGYKRKILNKIMLWDFQRSFVAQWPFKAMEVAANLTSSKQS